MISTVFSSSNPDGIDLDDTPIYYHYIGDDYGDHPPLGECPNESSSTTVGHFELSNYFFIAGDYHYHAMPGDTYPYNHSTSFNLNFDLCASVDMW